MKLQNNNGYLNDKLNLKTAMMIKNETDHEQTTYLKTWDSSFTVRCGLPSPPKNCFYKLANQKAQISEMPKVSKDVFKFSFFARSITEWNLLPEDLVNCKSFSDFKLNLGKHVK